MKRGRDRGFQIGSGVGSASDLEQSYTFTPGKRFDTLATKRANNSVSRTFRYGYLASTGLVSSISIDGAHPFTVNRGYHADLDLLTSIDTKWSTASRTRYDYTHNALYQRDSAKQSGDVFGDYGEPTFNRYSYNARGELTGAPAYMGSNVADLSRTLPGRQHAFDYDSIGNRKSTNRTGNAALKESYFGNDAGTQEGANALNQYKRKENDSIPVQGTVDAASTTVAVAGSAAAAGRQGRYWAAEAVVPNGSGPWQGSLLAYAAKIAGGSGGADLIRTEIRTAQIAQTLQAFAYDDDGNLTTDGLWNYQWDAENRLVRMTTTLVAASFGITNRVLEFRYDYRDRRVQKRVLDGTTLAEISSRRYLYNGWDLVAEFDSLSTLTLTRSYTWGLDLVGSLTASGGVGALLQIHDHAAGKTLLPTYDGNGNIASLLNADSGSVEAAYEYDPSGQLLRAEGAYAKTNPFRFSTKFQDEETGLIYYGYRYYSASMGRFINRDPIEESGGINLYGFAGNDGVNRWDYLGQLVIDVSVLQGVGPSGSTSINFFKWLQEQIAKQNGVPVGSVTFKGLPDSVASSLPGSSSPGSFAVFAGGQSSAQLPTFSSSSTLQLGGSVGAPNSAAIINPDAGRSLDPRYGLNSTTAGGTTGRGMTPEAANATIAVTLVIGNVVGAAALLPVRAIAASVQAAARPISVATQVAVIAFIPSIGNTATIVGRFARYRWNQAQTAITQVITGRRPPPPPAGPPGGGG